MKWRERHDSWKTTCLTEGDPDFNVRTENANRRARRREGHSTPLQPVRLLFLGQQTTHHLVDGTVDDVILPHVGHILAAHGARVVLIQPFLNTQTAESVHAVERNCLKR